MSYVLKHGIKVIPMPIARAGEVASWYYLKITKISEKTGKEIEVRQKNKIKYPLKDKRVKELDPNGKYVTLVRPSVWTKIEEIYDYYYKKLKKLDEKAISTK